MTGTIHVDGMPVSPDGATSMSSACFAKKGEFVSRNIAGETILVPIRGRIGDLDSIYNLNEVACLIWNRIDGRTTLQQLVEGVCAEFDVAPDTAESDTQQFIAALQGAGLIEPGLDAKE